ncbi:MAG: hypothetical protein GC154_07200 [bacterium]|nr:hypothetical protein [bacterium]
MDPISGALVVPVRNSTRSQTPPSNDSVKIVESSQVQVSRVTLVSLAENAAGARAGQPTRRGGARQADSFETAGVQPSRNPRTSRSTPSLASFTGQSQPASTSGSIAGGGLFDAPAPGKNGDSSDEPAIDTKGDPKLDAYINLIRSLSKDDPHAQDLLNRIEEFQSSSSSSSSSQDGAAQLEADLTAYLETRGQINIHIEGRLPSGGASNSESVQFQQQGEVQQSDPIVIDLDGDGVELTTAKSGAMFDINGDGTRERTAFATGGDAFLALDRNRDGLINNGLELFGDQHGARDGFEELRKFDGDRNGVIDERDAIYGDLLLYSDRNLDGVSQTSELQSLRAAGIAAIQLDSRLAPSTLQGGSLLSTASYLRSDGSSGTAADVMVDYIA